MDFLITVDNVCFNARAHGFKDIHYKVLSMVSLYDAGVDVDIRKDFNQCGEFRIIFPKKYNHQAYKKFASVVLYEINKANYSNIKLDD